MVNKKPKTEKSLFDKVLEDTGKALEKAKEDIEKSIENYSNIDGEVIEALGSIIVTIELPGVKKDNINIKVTDRKVNVRAVIDEETLSNEGIQIKPEDRKRGEIIKVLKLPRKVIPEQAVAEFKNNILKIEIPKMEQEKSFDVKIK